MVHKYIHNRKRGWEFRMYDSRPASCTEVKFIHHNFAILDTPKLEYVVITHPLIISIQNIFLESFALTTHAKRCRGKPHVFILANLVNNRSLPIY